MANISGGILRLTLWLYINIGGILYAAGSAGSAMVNGTPTHAWSIPSIESYTPDVDKLVKTERYEGDKKQPGLIFGSNALKGFTCRITDRRSDIMAAMQGTTLDTTSNTEFEISTPEADAASVVLGGAMLCAQEQDSDGGLHYRNRIIPRWKGVFTEVKGKSQEMDSWDIEAICHRSAYTPWGSLISDLGINAPDGKVSSFDIVSDYPLHMTSLLSLTGTTTFTTLYRPGSTVVALNAANNWFFRTHVAQALTSLSGAGLATMASAGGDGAPNVLVYGVQPRFPLA